MPRSARPRRPLPVYKYRGVSEVTQSQACRFLPFPTTARSTSDSAGHKRPPRLLPRSICLDQHIDMRTCAVAFAALLLLLLLTTRAHGIRLDKQLHEAINSKETADPKSGDGEASIADDSVEKHCTPDGRCSGSKVKRALAHAEATAEAKQQQVSSTGNGGHSTRVDAAEAAEAASQPRQRQQTFPDLMDIAGMDYSPATRKPPIHN